MLWYDHLFITHPKAIIMTDEALKLGNNSRTIWDDLLVEAAKLGDLKRLRIAMDNGVDKNVRADALNLAKEKQHIDCINMLSRAIEDEYRLNRYELVGENVVSSNKGYIKGMGRIRRVFDFQSRIVYNIVEDKPGIEKSFGAFRQNQEDILKAYEWLQTNNTAKMPPHPFHKQRYLSRR